MRELLNELAMKNGRKKASTKLKKMAATEESNTEALIAKLASSIGVTKNENVDFENAISNATSAEELENILRKLKFMGDKGKRVFELLKKQDTLLSEEATDSSKTTTPITSTTTSYPSQALDPSPLKVKVEESVEENLLRQKREFVLKTAMMSKELNGEEEEKANLAIEEVTNSKYMLRQAF